MQGANFLQALALEFKYEGHPKHKMHPHAYGLATFSGRRGDATFCDLHAKFPPGRMHLLKGLFQDGIKAGLTGANDTAHDEPTIVWCIDDNGWIFEARITTASQAVYHGFPVRAGEAIAQEVIKRYSDYVRRLKSSAGTGGNLKAAVAHLKLCEEKLKNAEEMYR